jgi:hypothetical protein
MFSILDAMTDTSFINTPSTIQQTTASNQEQQWWHVALCCSQLLHTSAYPARFSSHRQHEVVCVVGGAQVTAGQWHRAELAAGVMRTADQNSRMLTRTSSFAARVARVTGAMGAMG